MSFEEQSDPRFEDLLRATGATSYDPEWLRESGDTVVGLWPDLTIAYVNPSWFRFARENGADGAFAEQWSVGRSLLDAIPDLLRAHHTATYEQCLEQRAPVHADYECSTPERFRVFRSTTYPLHGDGLLVVHSLRVDRAHDRAAEEPDVERLVDAHGMLTQCSYCRRFAEPPVGKRWLWIPAWVREPPVRVTHGICPPCVGYYFGRPRDGSSGGPR